MRKHRDLLRITEVRSCCYFLLTASNVVDPNASRCPTGSTPLRSAQDDGLIKPPSGREGDHGGRFPNVNVMSVWGSPVVVEGARRE